MSSQPPPPSPQPPQKPQGWEPRTTAEFEQWWSEKCPVSVEEAGRKTVAHAAWHDGWAAAAAAPRPQDAASDALKEMEARKDTAYLERNRVVAALAKCFPSGVQRTAIVGWSEDWHGCVYIDLPTGQVSWHFHDSQADLFAGLPPYTKPWDGHDTDEKYRRLSALALPPRDAALAADESQTCPECGGALTDEQLSELSDAFGGADAAPQGTGDTPPAWVPVGERKPSKEGAFLVVEPGRNPGFQVVTRYWDGESSWWGRGIDAVEVSHWMPLPSPPQPQRGPQGGTPTDAGREEGR